MQVDALVEENTEWAHGIARKVKRRLPPCFDIEELEQLALIGMWKAAKRYEQARGVPFQAFAIRWVTGEIHMNVRRRRYRDATMEELPWQRNDDLDLRTDGAPSPELKLCEEEEETQSAAAELASRREWLESVIGQLTETQEYLLRQVIEGKTLGELAAIWRLPEGDIRRRVTAAIRLLAKEAKDGKARLQQAETARAGSL
jgi:RNA polymerase sigma factor (sigma-70 family)